MRCLAEFEIRSDLAIEAASKKLVIRHPDQRYELHIKNRPHPEKQGFQHALIAVLFFDAEDIHAGNEIAPALMVEALNLLAFVTNSRFEYHRLLKIVDWTPNRVMRDALVSAERDDRPIPKLGEKFARSVEILSKANQAPELQRAFRWFRLGIAGETPDEQFQCFWFALETLAEAMKSSEKVHDKCPKCGGSLFCTACNEHPTHRPYNKQAIEQLLTQLSPQGKELFLVFNRVRNHLMHGARLMEVTLEEPYSPELAVEFLGQCVWHALFSAMPNDARQGLFLRKPQDFLRMRMGALAHIQTVVPTTADGDPDLDHFPEVRIELGLAPDADAASSENGQA